MADLPSSIAATDILGTLPRVLLRGNSTGGTDVEVSDGDKVRGFNGNTGTDLILQGGNSSVVSTAGGNVQLQAGSPGSGGEPGVVQMTNGGGDDTKPICSMTSEGANGATIHYFAGTQDPKVASVPAISDGDIYYKSDGRTYKQTIDGWLIANAGWNSLRTENSAYLATLVDSVIFVDASSGSVTITLPTAVGNVSKTYIINKRDSSGNTVIIDGDGSETINGATDVTISTQYNSVTIVSDGTEWGII